VALADIENRIIEDAEKQAKKMLQQAQSEAEERLQKMRAQLTREKRAREKTMAQDLEQAVVQSKQLYQLEASQKVLSGKRASLVRLQRELAEEILGDQALLESYFSKILKQLVLNNELHGQIEVSQDGKPALQATLKKLGLQPEVVTKSGWTAAQMEIVRPEYKINCSLDNYLQENLKKLEADITAELFT